MGEWRLAWDTPDACTKFVAVMQARRQGEWEEEFKPFERGWCHGSAEFREEMLNYIEQQKGKWHYGSELREAAEAKAERLPAEAAAAHGLSTEQFSWITQRASRSRRNSERKQALQ
jgi:hypothetical protein